MADSHEPAQESEWPRKVVRFTGPIFLILGGIALLGSWAITDPTVEKINMVTGAMVFFGLCAITLWVGLKREISRLHSQVDLLSKERDECGSDSPAR
ncbi:hypothetical protein [Rubinisphaera margarita]|uniref:hypothetical protein n=1 Tax=Rubinisphaera margarita TaxID=2909586 RepID=UPI001EE8EF7D|nr:hypothetical protein [Rubinisphaera margarita]MCG6158491.1 hypothetical protein [Rubinisphaera margarita]